MSPDTYDLVAHNIATASENKIHDDGTARRLGFSGGLVAGVEVYAYMTRAIVSRFGRAWLDHGTAECRFLKPVYDDHPVRISASEWEDTFTIEATSESILCAKGAAAMAFGSGAASVPDAVPYRTPPLERPAADARLLAPG